MSSQISLDGNEPFKSPTDFSLKEGEIDVNCQKYLMEKERIQRTIDIYNKGWDKNSVNTVNYWMDYLSYCCLIYHFYLFKLKKIENYWAWALIILTSLSSTISLLQYNNEIEELELAINISITFLTLFATLISAWMKKQNYVEHISELSKYSLKINKLKGEVNSIIREPIKNRMSYNDFIGKHKDEIVDCISVRPLISPMDWKETIYIISKYYPELAAYEYPWKKIPNYGENAMRTYEHIRYKGLWRKIKHGYFCKWFLCGNSRFERDIATSILRHDKQFYEKLPKSDFDSRQYDCGMLHSYDSFKCEDSNKEKFTDVTTI